MQGKQQKGKGKTKQRAPTVRGGAPSTNTKRGGHPGVSTMSVAAATSRSAREQEICDDVKNVRDNVSQSDPSGDSFIQLRESPNMMHSHDRNWIRSCATLW